MANKFIRFEGYWISCTNPELITKFDNLEVALLALKEKHQQGYENYGITKSRGRYELRKYHPEPYGKNTGFQKTNERSHLTITIGNIKFQNRAYTIDFLVWAVIVSPYTSLMGIMSFFNFKWRS